MKTNALLTMGLVILTAGVVHAAIYNDAMDNTSYWQLQKVNAGFWDVLYTVTKGTTYVEYEQTFVEPTYNKNLGALVWSAPAGEKITQVSFTYVNSLDPAIWAQVVYKLAPAANLDAITPVLWTAPLALTAKSQTLNYVTGDDVQRIGLGFQTITNDYPGWLANFSDVTITTTVVPEPASLGLLVLGTLGLVCRRRRQA